MAQILKDLETYHNMDIFLGVLRFRKRKVAAVAKIRKKDKQMFSVTFALKVLQFLQSITTIQTISSNFQNMYYKFI